MVDRYHIRNMETATLSTKYQLVIPRRVRERLGLEPGTRLTVIDKGGVLVLVPERPLRTRRGIVRGTSRRGLREKKDRL
jgi:AbrB family looped-hinge helix DNA binding protein